MNPTSLETKYLVLGELWSEYKDTKDSNWAEFFEIYDIGLPLAYASTEGLTTNQEEGNHLVELTWDHLLLLLDVEGSAEFESLQQVLDASPHLKSEAGLPTIKAHHALEGDSEYVALTENSYLNDDLDEIVRTVHEYYAGDAGEMH